jgi:hypothetical protein
MIKRLGKMRSFSWDIGIKNQGVGKFQLPVHFKK